MYFDTPHEKHYVLLPQNLEEVSLGLASARYLRELESFLDMLAQFNLVGGSTHKVDNYFLPNNE